MRKKSTSWGKEAAWYARHVIKDDSYHAKVIQPNIERLFKHEKGRVLEIGCGEGYFTRVLKNIGVDIDGSDIASELIEKAKHVDPSIPYYVADASNLSFAKNQSYSAVLAVLTLQNMESLGEVCREVRRVLSDNGRFIMVLNHPMFRVPKASSWGFDTVTQTQYRRVDRYLTASRVKIDMHPGQKNNPSFTYSFHRSFQDIMKSLRQAHFSITSLEEWISHRKSERGPKSVEEDRARKEFPLFMMIECEQKRT